MSTLFPDTSTDDLVARARAHYTPNYVQAPVFLVRGEGPWVWDRDDQADKLVHVSNLFHNEPAVALMEKLTEVSFADRVFFTNSGTEANEAALKLARRYWSVYRERADKSDILAFEDSFHGRTYASLSATGQPKYHKGFEPLVPGFHHAVFNDMASVEQAFADAGGRIGAVIVEPIQCEGGLKLPDEGFLRKLRAACDAHEALLILDEVQTGCGRTGEWFAYEIFGVRPDIMTLAKGIAGGVPLGAMLCTDEASHGFAPGAHATTFGGNPLATRAGLEVFRTIEDERLLDHTFEVGSVLQQGLERLVASHPERCVEARGYGLLRGVELKVDDDAALVNNLVAACRERGLLINGIAGRVLRIAPPLIIERGHIKLALDILDEALGAV